MYSIICADDNRYWLEALAEGLSMDPEFHVVATAINGKIAIESIEQLKPDIILLDIIMPEYDGVYIVNHIRTLTWYDPIIYILSGIGTDTVITILNELDIDYYNLKPVTIDTIHTNLNNIITAKNRKAVSNIPSCTPPTSGEIIDDVLLHLGLYNNVMYTKFIREALLLYMQDPDYNRMLTKRLYPTIARQYGTTASAVEKNIRLGITHIEEENSELYHTIFPFASKGKKVTNSLLLSMVSGYIFKKIYKRN